MLNFVVFFFFKQKTAYDMRISDWSSDVCSSDLTIVSVLGSMLIFTLQVLFASFEQLILSFFPLAENVAGWLGLSRIAQAIVLFPALYGLFYSLTPHRYRYSDCPKWPGALLVTIWWMATTALLPKVMRPETSREG